MQYKLVVQTTKVLLLIIFADIDPIADSSSKTKEFEKHLGRKSCDYHRST